MISSIQLFRFWSGTQNAGGSSALTCSLQCSRPSERSKGVSIFWKYCSFHSSIYPPKDDLDIFEVAPRLRKVTINGMMNSGESTLNLPCSQITTYRGNFSSAMSRDIVSKQSAALKHLDLRVHGAGAHLSSLELSPIRMKNVTSFSMEFPQYLLAAYSRRYTPKIFSANLHCPPWRISD